MSEGYTKFEVDNKLNDLKTTILKRVQNAIVTNTSPELPLESNDNSLLINIVKEEE